MISPQRLDAVCDISMGQAPSGDAYNYEGEGWPLIAGAGDFGDLYPVVKKYTTTAARLSKYGDIVLGIRASIGEKVMSDGEYCLGRGVAGLRAKPNLTSRYLWHWLTHAGPRLASKAKGATFKQVNKDDIGELEIALPSLPEQRRIAAILDQADAIRAKRREALAQLDSLTQSLFIEMFGDPVSNARGWSSRSLGDVLTLITYGITVRPAYVEDGAPLISAREIRSGLVDSLKAPMISMEDFHKLSEKSRIQNGDILFSKTGSIGHCAVVQTNAFMAVSQNVARMTFNRKCVNSTYALNYLRSPSIQQLAQTSAKGNAVKDLQLGVMKSFPFPLPPISLQNEFADRVGKIASQLDLHRSALALCEALFATLHHRAFEGEL